MSRQTPHLLARTEPGPNGPINVALCGADKGWSDSWFTSDVTRVNCSKCNAKIGQGIMKAEPRLALGERDEEPDKQWQTYKSIYPVQVDGEIVAYVAIANGWGKRWHVHEIELDDEGTPYPLGGVYDWSEGMRATGMKRNEFRSKEQAALAAFRLAEIGELLPAAKLQQKILAARKVAEEREAQRAADKERYRQEAEAKRQQKEARHQEIAEGLASIAQRESLSNFERDALAAAYREFSGKDLPVKTEIAS